jgi:predicted O-methyltransferase YrrM
MSWSSKVRNTAQNAFKPGYARVMTAKLLQRGRRDERRRADAIEWARPRAVRIREWCSGVDAELWQEASAFGKELRARADALGAELGVHLGGGGRAEFLYFVTRLRRPKTVVETGVLHGYSSAAILGALARNGDGGRLWSSDFPYFREKDPEKLVGVLVPDELRADWTLLLHGDRRNLPEILAAVESIDLFHYDSDKTYAGRHFGVELVEPKLAPGAVILMDDIQDNLFFRDWAKGREAAASARGESVDVQILGSGSAFVGAFGLPSERSGQPPDA